jgi:hypothetical protein
MRPRRTVPQTVPDRAPKGGVHNRAPVPLPIRGTGTGTVHGAQGAVPLHGAQRITEEVWDFTWEPVRIERRLRWLDPERQRAGP